MKFSTNLSDLHSALRVVSTFASQLSGMADDPTVLIEANRSKRGKGSLRLSYADEQMYTYVDIEAEVAKGGTGEIAVPIHYLMSLRGAKSATINVEADDSTFVGDITAPKARAMKFNLAILVETEQVRAMMPDEVSEPDVTLCAGHIMAGLAMINFSPVRDEDPAPIRIDFAEAEIEFSAQDPYRFGYAKIDPSAMRAEDSETEIELPEGETLIVDRNPFFVVLQQMDPDDEFDLYVGERMYAFRGATFFVQFQKSGDYAMPEGGYDPREHLHIRDEAKRAGTSLRIDGRAFTEAVSQVAKLSLSSLQAEPRLDISVGKSTVKMSVTTDVGDTEVICDVTVVKRAAKKVSVNAQYLNEMIDLSSGECVVRWHDDLVIVESEYGSVLAMSVFDDS